MRVIDYKDGIKGEAPRLLLMSKKKYCLTRHYEYKQHEHILCEMSHLFDAELMDTVTHFPEVFINDIMSPLCGLVNTMLYLGKKYDYLPQDAETLYWSLKLIKMCDRLESLLSFSLNTKEKDLSAVTNEIRVLTGNVIAEVEARLEDGSQWAILKDRCTIVDFTIVGLYLGCYEKQELREILTSRLEQAPRLWPYIQRQVQHLLPVLVLYGQHLTCHASGHYSTIYWLLMSQARLPFEIVPSPEPWIQIANVKYRDMGLALKMIAEIMGFDTSEKGPLLEAAVQLWSTAPELWETTKASQLAVMEEHFRGLGKKGLLYRDKARLDELYCIGLRRDKDRETSAGIVERLLPALWKYATEWLRLFTRKETCLLLLSNIAQQIKPVNLEYLIYYTTAFPHNMIDMLKGIGYKVETLFLGLGNCKERLLKIKDRPDYREGRLDILNLCDGSEDDGCTGASAYQALDELQIPFAGCPYNITKNTTYKEYMKDMYMKNGIPTAPFIAMSKWDPTISTAHIPYPVIIKPSAGCASIGITKDSKCSTPAELEARMKMRNQKPLYNGVYLIESFIQGPEFTVLVSGGPTSDVLVYAPVERVFNRAKHPADMWISIEEAYDNTLYKYKKVVQPELAATLTEIAKKAHLCLEGGGCTRTDLRQDAQTGEIFALETNAPCGIGFKYPPYYILKYSGLRLEDLLAFLIAASVH
jgi:D-alanine-D-alanine ligase-like ATP-grasp enzyme